MCCNYETGTLLTAQLGTPARTDAWVKANCTRLSRTSNLAKGATIVANGLRDVLGSRSSQRTQHAAHTARERNKGDQAVKVIRAHREMLPQSRGN